MIDDHRRLIDSARRQWEAAQATASRAGGADSAANACALAGSATDGGAMPGDPADSIPGYRLERLVHRGGQGAVYRAVQISTRRTVAIKILRERSLPLGPERARFEREVEILGELDHPNIVRVIDSGSANGRDFLAMDYIDGAPLDRASASCAGSWTGTGSARDSAVAPGNPREGVRRTLRLFADVCDAVHAAHLHGVIHRDLKPGNILVDSQGRPRIVDFGLAKRSTIDASDLAAAHAVTETGQFLGSLPWASPEQVAGASGGVDLRSDVYSLGVVLYQLLTGEFPYRVTGPVGEITRNIQVAEPRAPSDLAAEVDDELETIVLKSLEKEPERRYQSAGDFARDLRHHLAGEVIEAKRASIRYVLGKHLRRHRLVAAIAATLAVVVIGSSIVSISLWRRAASERDLKESQRLRAESINGVLHRILASANPERGQGNERTVVEALDDAIAEIEAGSLSNAPDVEASVRVTIAEAYLALGRIAEAQAQVDRAVAILDSMPEPSDPDRARALAVLGRLHVIGGDYIKSMAQLEQAISLLRSFGMPPRHDSARHPQDQLPALLIMLSGTTQRTGDAERTAALQEQAIDYAVARWGADHPQARRVQLDVKSFNYGGKQGVELLEQALALDREMLGPRHPQTHRTLMHLAAELHLRGRFDDSERRYLEAIELGRSIYGERHPDNLRIVANLDWLYGHTKQFEKSVTLLREWEPAALAIFGAKSVRGAEFVMLLGCAEVSAGELDPGERTLRRALDLFKSIGRDQSFQGAECRIRIGRVIVQRLRTAERDAIAPQGSDADPAIESEPVTEPAPEAWAALEEAGRLARETLAISNDEVGSLALRHAHARVLLGDVLARRGEFAEAEAILLEAHAAL
ncbi:MAG: tetratricopeptide repeat protein, partial [Phycisphaerae bacterium]|nr:tetratricopeptide repeat protein [Phycisphaerae bacterium]